MKLVDDLKRLSDQDKGKIDRLTKVSDKDKKGSLQTPEQTRGNGNGNNRPV